MRLRYKNILFITFAMIFLCKTVYATELNINANCELNNKCKVGHIAPIKVTVEALDNDVDGNLNLYILNEKYTHNIKLSKNNKKDYIFNVPIKNITKNIRISVENNGEVLSEKKLNLNILDNNKCFLGILSDNSKQYNFLGDIKIMPLNINKSEIIDLGNMELTNSILDNLSFIALDNFEIEQLSDNSKNNLDKWIRNGGSIFIGIGKYKYKNLKGPFEGIKQVATVGNGCIVPINFELSDRANVNKFEKLILNNLNNKSLNDLTGNTNIKKDTEHAEQLKGVADNMLKINKNIIYFLISVVVLYIVCMFIVVIWKKGKVCLWMGTICIFSLIVFIVYVTQGIGQEKVTTACMNTYFDNGYSKSSLMNIYPCKNKVNLTFDNLNAMVSNGEKKKCYLDPVDEHINYTDIKETNYLYTLTTKHFENELCTKLMIENNHINGEIKNPLLYDLNACCLILGNTFVKIGNIKTGDSIKLDYDLDNNLQCTGDYQYINIVEKSLNDKYEKELFKYYFNTNTYENINCKLVGFSKRKVPQNINHKNRKINSMNIEVIPINIEFNSKQIEIPSGFIKPIVKELQDDNNKSVREYTFKKDENINIHYILPKDVKINKIQLSDSFKDGQFIVERFNYKLNTWEKLNNLLIENLDDLNDNKLLVLRIKGSGRLLIPDISLKGVLN